jgi:small GTP-binding protein
VPEVRVPAADIPLGRRAEARIAVVGTPNSGKSTLFNRLTGLSQRIGNYPGVTVERHLGRLRDTDKRIELIDLPGTHGLTPHSIEEQVTVDALFGLLETEAEPDGIVLILDASNLYQGLYLAQQVLETGLPVVVALTMIDAARAGGLTIDIDALSECLGGAAVFPVVATTGEGMAGLREAIATITAQPVPRPPDSWPEFSQATAEIAADTGLAAAVIGRALIDPASNAARSIARNPDAARAVDAARTTLFGDEPPIAAEARRRYAWARERLASIRQSAAPERTSFYRMAQVMNRPWPGTIGLFVVMLIVFQAVFAWATPFMDLIDAGSGSLAGLIHESLGRRHAGELPRGWRCRRRWQRCHIPAADPDPVYFHHPARGLRLPGACGVPDGSRHALGGAVRPVDYSNDFKLRLCGAGDHGDAGHPKPARSHRDHHGGAVHDLLCAATRVRAVDCGVRSGRYGRDLQSAGPRAVRAVRLRYCHGRPDGAPNSQDHLAGPATCICTDAARVSAGRTSAPC